MGNEGIRPIPAKPVESRYELMCNQGLENVIKDVTFLDEGIGSLEGKLNRGQKEIKWNRVRRNVLINEDMVDGLVHIGKLSLLEAKGELCVDQKKVKRDTTTKINNEEGVFSWFKVMASYRFLWSPRGEPKAPFLNFASPIERDG
ncbi:hypothetical protein LWI28_002555 [Acer negundo]|uniref:Uncharacterized protein n=1 Tax=Acer negundo TaxID=4023 RepID=A0AAD5J9T8_ACENE|nr:hypothetical protein LWI28_002555 [Acer negundo]